MPTDKLLRKKILNMVKVDQGIRRKFLKGGQWNKEIDIRNTKKMKDIVKKYGWPGKSLVGENGGHGAPEL